MEVWQKIHTQLRHQVRNRLEKTDNPTAGIIDSQSVKTAKKGGILRFHHQQTTLIHLLGIPGRFRQKMM